MAKKETEDYYAFKPVKEKLPRRGNSDEKNNVIISDGNEELTTSLKDDNKHVKISSIDEITKGSVKDIKPE